MEFKVWRANAIRFTSAGKMDGYSVERDVYPLLVFKY